MVSIDEAYSPTAAASRPEHGVAEHGVAEHGVAEHGPRMHQRHDHLLAAFAHEA